MTSKDDAKVEALDSFDRAARRSALAQLAAGDLDAVPASDNVNMHMHSFYSFNAQGWSPSRIAWEAHRAGLYAAGLCDFDVLDGVEEFTEAGLTLGLRTSTFIESRVFVEALSDKEISSPGEPGVGYLMGAGFGHVPAAGSAAGQGLDALRQAARTRNVELVDRINAAVPDIAVDYDSDIMPMTPQGTATERHIVRAYADKSRAVFGSDDALAAYWGDLLGIERSAASALVGDTPAFEDAVRSKLAKRGGVGYVQPSSDTFPKAEAFTAWVKSCGAIPMLAWLDGVSEGEADAGALLDCMQAAGCVALNIIPDRNWNYQDLKTRVIRVANLNVMVAAAVAREMPINIGTEMNKAGLPFVDDLGVDALRQHRDVFISGAQVMVGQSLLSRYADYTYVGEQAAEDFKSLADRNAFFAKVGALPPMAATDAERLAGLGPVASLDWFRAAVK